MNKLEAVVSIWNLFNDDDKKKFIYLQLIIIVASFLELLSIFSIGPFVSVVLGVVDLDSIPIIGSFIVQYFQGIEIYILAIFVSLSILTSNLFFAYTLYKKAIFSYSLGANTSNNIVQAFMSNKLNKEKHNKNEIVSKATFESDRFAKSVVNELIQINARFTVAIAIVIFLIFNYGFIFLLFVFYIATIYLFISFFLRERLSVAGKNLTFNNNARLRNINDIYDTFYEIKSYYAENFFLDRQKKLNKSIGTNLSNIELYSILPKYLVESIVFISLIGFLTYQYSNNVNINMIIPSAVQLIYGIMKLIPQISNIYQAYSNFSGNLMSINEISHVEELIQDDFHISSQKVNQIVLHDIDFYRGNKAVFSRFNYTFTKNNIYLIQGVSGIGKSTMLSLLFGLLKPTSGSVKFLDGNSNSLLNPKIAFIPQNHFLVYGNINNNIAFGVDESNIEHDKVSNVLKHVKLAEFISNVDSENIKMSGGQIQRVCIGRYLYHNFDVVLFDEPTSALDSENEKVVFELIKENKENKIIIIVSHSKLALKYVDKIIRLG